MQRDEAYLLDVLQAAQLAITYVEGKTLEAFLEDLQLQDSVIRRLEIAGEASRRVSEQTKAVHPELPWHDMIGMRNFLIHEYGNVDLQIVWDTLQLDLPPLITALERILSTKDS